MKKNPLLWLQGKMVEGSTDNWNKASAELGWQNFSAEHGLSSNTKTI